MDEAPKRKSGFLGFVKNFILFLLLAGIIIASFWVSFLLGKRILVPVKKIPEPRIEIAIPEPPPSIAALQEFEEVLEKEKAESPQVTVGKTEPKRVEEPNTTKETGYSQSGTQYYKVQAALYADKGRALELAQRLDASGFATYLKKANAGWRVQVGAFKKKSHALHLQRSLKIKGFESKIIYE